jgi:hypothetical protein
MSTYRLKDGSNQALLDLIVVGPQPRSQGIQYTRRTHAADGTVYEEGPYVVWEFTALTDAQYATLLTAFGLSASATTNAVTIYTIDRTTNSWVRKNGTIMLPELGRDARRRDYFMRDVEFTIRALVTAS